MPKGTLNMKFKKIFITAVCVVCALTGVWLIVSNLFDFNFHLNLIKYNTVSDGEFTFTFKGAFSQVRKLIVRRDSKKIASLPFEASSDVFGNAEKYEPVYSDINFDGHDDIMFVCAYDDDGDIHYSAFIYNPDENTYSYCPGMDDLCNIKVIAESQAVTSEQTERIQLNEPKDGKPALYNEKHSLTEYRWIDGKFTAFRETAITYYEDTDYYSYSVYVYDAEYGGLKYEDEKWFDASELENYKLG